MRERRPRQKDKHYLAWLHELPCVVTGHIGEGVQAAHIRFADAGAGKDLTGMGRKPDDHWCLPLHWKEHTTQHQMDERKYWERAGKDPLALCRMLKGLFPDTLAATQFITAQVSQKRRRP